MDPDQTRPGQPGGLTQNKKMKDETTEKSVKSQIAKMIGKSGGLATYKKRGKAYMKKIGIKGATERWNKRSKKEE